MMSHLDETTHYSITVEGTIDATLADWCGPVMIIPSRTSEGVLTTTLRDIVADQAALVGLVRRLHGLGIVLLTVERLH
jgi:hypothetical protein